MNDRDDGLQDLLQPLKKRRYTAREVLYVCLGMLGISLILLAVLVGPPRQLVDVHVHRDIAIMFRNEADLSSWTRAVDPLAIGLPGIAGVALAATALLVWSLAKRDRMLIRCCGLYLAAVLMMGPLLSSKASDTLLPKRELTISAEAGKRRAAGLHPTLTKYMLAQAAYIEGDYGLAQKLSKGLTTSKLYTRFEAPWRLELLKGGSAVHAMECRSMIGCIDPAKATFLRWLAIAACLALFIAFMAAFQVWSVLDRRIENVDRMLAGR